MRVAIDASYVLSDECPGHLVPRVVNRYTGEIFGPDTVIHSVTVEPLRQLVLKKLKPSTPEELDLLMRFLQTKGTECAKAQHQSPGRNSQSWLW